MLSGKGERLLTGPATVAVILLLFWLALAASLRDKSLTYDEGPFAVAGCSYWRLGDYRLSPETGLLPQRVAGLALALGHYKFPSVESSDWRNARLPTLAYDWFYQLGNNAEQMAAAGRAACGVLAVALGAVVWAWSRQLFGPRGGMVSLILYVLNPAILANGALMTSDMAAALFFLAASWGWWGMLHRISGRRLLGSALLAGGLFVSKMSAVLIIPVMLALATARLFDGRPLPVAIGRWRREIGSRTGQALAFAIAGSVHAAVIVAVIWSLSGFRFSAFADPAAGGRFVLPWEYALNQSDPSATGIHQRLSAPDQAIDFMRRHELLPEGWLYGFAYVVRRAEARPAFWNGECSQTGWPGFFPYAFLVKTPLGVFGVCGLALAAGWMSWKAKSHSVRGAWRQFYATLPLWVLPAVYWVAAISSHLNIGHRHLLPVYAPMFVLCGASARWLGGKRWPGAALCGLLAILAAESFWFFPELPGLFQRHRPSLGRLPAPGGQLAGLGLQELPAARRYIEQHPEEGPFISLISAWPARPTTGWRRACFIHSACRICATTRICRWPSCRPVGSAGKWPASGGSKRLTI